MKEKKDNGTANGKSWKEKKTLEYDSPVGSCSYCRKEYPLHVRRKSQVVGICDSCYEKYFSSADFKEGDN